MAGAWRGRRGADTVEEHWSGPEGESLMGMFRWLREGKARFFELLTIEAEGECLVLRIKHFHPGLKGWEEKDQAVSFDLVQLGHQEAVFYERSEKKVQWMVYRRDGNALATYFEPEEREHKPEEEFVYQRG
jgi:hypothetical protein